MPIRLRDRWFIFVPPGARTSDGEPSPSGRWAIPYEHAGTEDKRIAYAISQGAKNIQRNDKIEWMADIDPAARAEIEELLSSPTGRLRPFQPPGPQ